MDVKEPEASGLRLTLRPGDLKRSRTGDVCVGSAESLSELVRLEDEDADSTGSEDEGEERWNGAYTHLSAVVHYSPTEKESSLSVPGEVGPQALTWLGSDWDATGMQILLNASGAKSDVAFRRPRRRPRRRSGRRRRSDGRGGCNLRRSGLST
ncbi:hypothetical protein L226DRAFT_230197 [Lentinus tigrinus ALCF2SS1-7]|uniref:uncharacterized protein n=1 Tax=Lentinus tigrinus ALCF2SS1-7 TaxID=1328758 RepID=UPI0011661735|nr:hypothetical protein L226DRAFT_230197 [Lentinus tigrinus ALCF2SS1-7]